ncbi:MAG: PD40 domain-containing protein [Phycisphaerales bacterium]|nr:PD40 domain-containing protein [Phycisphaerales bacterium]
MRAYHFALIGLLATSGHCLAQPDWAAAEAPVLTQAIELTSRDMFVKAGEQYFSPDGKWMIFQGIPVPAAGENADANYSMYVAKFTFDADGNISGIETPIRVSNPGSANTCGWFHPTHKGEIMFGSTLAPPSTESGPGYQRLGGKYAWQFPHEMEVVTRKVAALGADTDSECKPLFRLPGYDAECSYSPDGRYVLYAHVDDEKSGELGRPDADLYVFDTQTSKQIPLVTAAGYDGGPFFSPDMSYICYRSDRLGDGNLQLFVAELDYGSGGEIKGIKREVQVTNNEHVNWAPYFHPSGQFMIYTTSELGHTNYEVFAIEFNPDKPMDELWKKRITFAEGFDGLPVFSRDGKWMIWCAQRGEVAAGEERPSSQVWATKFDAKALLKQVSHGSSY